MSRRYQEILSELTNRASKKSRISGKQLLSLIREFCFYASLPSDRQWVSSVLQIVKGTAESDTDYKILRTCLYLVVSSLLHDDWKNNEKERTSLLAELINVVKTEMREMSGSKASFLCRTYGSLLASAPVKSSASLTTVAEALNNLKQSTAGEKQKFNESEVQIWTGMLSALLRIVDGHTRQGTFFIPANCIDPIFAAASSADTSVARHGSALLLQAASHPNGENKVESYGLAIKVVSSFQTSQRALNLIDPLSSSRILQTIAALSLRKGVDDSLILELNLCAFIMLQHPR
jgi:hypothetical protein